MGFLYSIVKFAVQSGVFRNLERQVVVVVVGLACILRFGRLVAKRLCFSSSSKTKGIWIVQYPRQNEKQPLQCFR